MHNNSQLISWAHKIVTAGILATGTFFNLCALFFGMELVAKTFFTFTGETILTAWFFSAFVLGVAAEFTVPLANRTLRIVRRVVTFYMFMLTMMHGVNNILLDNVAFYTRVFSGPFYMYPALLVLGGLTIFVASLPVPTTRRPGAA